MPTESSSESHKPIHHSNADVPDRHTPRYTSEVSSAKDRLSVVMKRLGALVADKTGVSYERVFSDAESVVGRMSTVLDAYVYVKENGGDQGTLKALDVLAGGLATKAIELDHQLNGGVLPEKLEGDDVDIDDPTEEFLVLPTEEFIHTTSSKNNRVSRSDHLLVGKGRYIDTSELAPIDELLAKDIALINVTLYDRAGELMRRYSAMKLEQNAEAQAEIEQTLDLIMRCKEFFDSHYGAVGLEQSGGPSDKLELNAFHLLLTRVVEKVDRVLGSESGTSDIYDETQEIQMTQEIPRVGEETRQFSPEEAARLVEMTTSSEQEEGVPEATAAAGFGGRVVRALRTAADWLNRSGFSGDTEESSATLDELLEEDEVVAEVIPEATPRNTELDGQYRNDLDELQQQREELLAVVGGDVSRFDEFNKLMLEDITSDMRFIQEMLGIEEEPSVAEPVEAPKPPEDELALRRQKNALLAQLKELTNHRDAAQTMDPGVDTSLYDTGIHELLGKIQKIDERTAA